MVTKRKHAIRIVIEDVELTVTQVGNSVSVHRVIGRDRKRKLDITRGKTFELVNPVAITLLEKMKRAAALSTARCTCDYRYGYSDHAEHCRSIYVARYDGARNDD